MKLRASISLSFTESRPGGFRALGMRQRKDHQLRLSRSFPFKATKNFRLNNVFVFLCLGSSDGFLSLSRSLLKLGSSTRQKGSSKARKLANLCECLFLRALKNGWWRSPAFLVFSFKTTTSPSAHILPEPETWDREYVFVLSK